jgi:hypothetical protein
MKLADHVDEPTVLALQRLLPGVVLEPIITPVPTRSGTLNAPVSVSVKLPPAPAADYQFELTFEPERQIHAQLLDASNQRIAFWYMPFEDAAFGDSPARLDEAFIQTLERLLSHETRIVQRRGLLTHSFTCEYRAIDEWKRISGISYLRWFAAPRIKGRQHVYHSPSLTNSPPVRDP